ncbi:glycosyltransferase family 87 protein [cf. Phormidesmis sp. LEGE 11477]|uniref:glycosyltransferase family 87 protein n=1 Tax=cf. Phormidesmis sp. LEGE 11477 TaxID=1828680 RepID=UPI00187FC751|nr:glycosyltransferase family 87 protein [cf. Phormidesmis sp. LEGE 11477]MBE9064632.1 DUF2029 domain-containing protein [cf. Phormidesmis sp. LEGE 11477]
MTAQLWRKDISLFCGKYLMYFLPIMFFGYLMLDSYQVDFRAMYVSGKAALLGWDPYLNHVGVRPDFYAPLNGDDDPGSGYRYPPFAAIFLFIPFSLLPYLTAKVVFTVLMVVVFGMLCFFVARRSDFKTPESAILFALVSFPMLALIDRGQIDIFVTYLAVLSFGFWQQRQQTLLAAFLLAIAVMTKLFPIVLLSFYCFRRQWRMVSYTLMWAIGLFLLPLPYFGRSTYENFFKQLLPDRLGEVTSNLPMDLHGQGVGPYRIVQSIETTGLSSMKDFGNGYMTQIPPHHPWTLILVGLLLSVLLLIATHRCPTDFQFYAFLNMVFLFNPIAWIMGLVWYIPFFLYLSSSVSKVGLWLLLLPLFLPPFLNANGIAAYVMCIVLALGWQIPSWQKVLFRGQPALP